MSAESDRPAKSGPNRSLEMFEASLQLAVPQYPGKCKYRSTDRCRVPCKPLDAKLRRDCVPDLVPDLRAAGQLVSEASCTARRSAGSAKNPDAFVELRFH